MHEVCRSLSDNILLLDKTTVSVLLEKCQWIQKSPRAVVVYSALVAHYIITGVSIHSFVNIFLLFLKCRQQENRRVTFNDH